MEISDEDPAKAMAALRQNMIDLEAEDEKLEKTDLIPIKVPDAAIKAEEEEAEQKPPKNKKAKNKITKEEPDPVKTSRYAHLLKEEEDDASDEEVNVDYMNMLHKSFLAKEKEREIKMK